MVRYGLAQKLGAGDEYNPWISLKKFVYGFLVVLIPLFLVYTSDWVQVPGNIPPEYIWLVPLIVALINTILNVTKHWKDESS